MNTKLKKTHFLFFSCFIALLACQTTPAFSSNAKILYSGTPPAGENYFAASIACANLDDIPGDEIILTDDFGSFQILKWDSVKRKFTEEWVSDPVFETCRIKEIFALNISGKNPFLIFKDTSNNLHVFNRQKYVVNDLGEIFFDGFPANERINDFAVGEFDLKNKGWELVTLRCGLVKFGLNKITFGIINTGHFTPELHQQSSNVLFNIDIDSDLEVEHFFPAKTHGLLIIPNSTENKNKITIHRTHPPFNKYSIIQISGASPERFGWAGQIRESGNSYLTAYIRDEKSQSRICFFNLDTVNPVCVQVSVPPNSSRWVLGDLDGDNVRELIVLDFLSQLNVYDLSSTFPPRK
ncbi:MAG: hypothetical protein ABIG42_07590 [bacterium]